MTRNSSDGRSTLARGALGIPLLALTALLFGVGASSAPTTPVVVAPPRAAASAARVAPSRVDGNEPSPYCLARFLTPLRAMAGLAPAEPRDGARPSDPQDAGEARDDGGAPAVARGESFEGALAALKDEWATRFGAPPIIEVRVATVPDPREMGLHYDFDSVIASLRLGVERGRDVRDANGASSRRVRFFAKGWWFPWDDGEVDDGRRRAADECRYTTPAVMVFRGDDRDAERFVILLAVGEAPTKGIQQAALVNAFSAAAQLHGGAGDADRTLKIIGPTFSGSAHSLRRALDLWPAPARRGITDVRVVSGSATGPDVGAILTGRAPVTSFQRTTRTERELECAFLGFARDALGLDAAGGDGAQTLAQVAVLHESGTEFGAALDETASAGCRLRPEVSLSFPIHVSAVREAYEAMDARDQAVAPREQKGPRRTALDVTLRETRVPLDIEESPSPKTTIAEDLALSNLLIELSREGARYVAISATDSSDAIFLARKIRDVAPDVRIAFFKSDALFVHPAFQQDLVGSFVVTPYPFLGADEFAPHTRIPNGRVEGPEGVFSHAHMPFNGELAEGVYNAVLAAEGADPRQLVEYSFFEDAQGKPVAGTELPIWIAAISSAGIVPVAASTAPSEHGDLYRGAPPVDAPRETQLALDLDPDESPPNLWHMIYAALILIAVAEQLRERRARACMPLRGPLALGEGAPASRDAHMDHGLDLALGRAKFHFYAAVRGFIVVALFGYMAAVQVLVVATYAATHRLAQWIALAAGVAALAMSAYACVRAARRALSQVRVVREYLQRVPRDADALFSSPSPSSPAGGRALGGIVEEEPGRLEKAFVLVWRWIARLLGFAEPLDRRTAAETSLQQLRVLSVFTVLVTCALSVWLLRDLSAHGFGLWNPFTKHPTPAMTSFVLRNLPLVNGVSASTAVLLGIACAYASVIGRMARLRVAHGLSLMSPPDGVIDAVSTPIRAILFSSPGADGRLAHDAREFTRVERAALNAIWRPSTGPRYFAALAGLVVFPLTLFFLRPPSSLETRSGTLLLVGELSVCTLVIGATLLQFVLYWHTLELLLKRILAHPLGRAFGRVEGFVRESIEDQVSRVPNDLLRLGAAAQCYAGLMRASLALDERALDAVGIGDVVRRARGRVGPLLAARDEALDASTSRERSARRACLAEGEVLGAELLTASRDVCAALHVAWHRAPPREEGAPASAPNAEAEPRTDAPDLHDDLTPLEGAIDPRVLAWLRAAETFVATVIALLVNRHVRQFRSFLYSLTAAALLLLLSLTSYAFEPHRLMLTCVGVLVASVVGVGLWIYLELEQNALLSHVSGTEPNRVTVTSALVLRVVGWVVLPLTSVAASQYPSVASVLFFWVEPFARALH